MVWALPFCVFLSFGRAVLLWAICAVTVVLYPIRYDDLLNITPLGVGMLNVRNLLLLIMLVWVVAGIGGCGRDRATSDEGASSLSS